MPRRKNRRSQTKSQTLTTTGDTLSPWEPSDAWTQEERDDRQSLPPYCDDCQSWYKTGQEHNCIVALLHRIEDLERAIKRIGI